MIRLYSSERCPYAQRTRIVLHEKGIPHEHVEIDLDKKPADFHLISPYGKVPVLVDGETRVYESSIINEYLDEKYPETPLMPKDPAKRAHVRVWIDFANTRVSPALFKVARGSDEERTSALLVLRGHFETLSHVVDAGPWLAGEEVTLAEATYAPYFQRLEARGVDISLFPALVAWWKRIAARPAYQASRIPPPG